MNKRNLIVFNTSFTSIFFRFQCWSSYVLLFTTDNLGFVGHIKIQPLSFFFSFVYITFFFLWTWFIFLLSINNFFFFFLFWSLTRDTEIIKDFVFTGKKLQICYSNTILITFLLFVSHRLNDFEKAECQYWWFFLKWIFRMVLLNKSFRMSHLCLTHISDKERFYMAIQANLDIFCHWMMKYLNNIVFLLYRSRIVIVSYYK